MPKKEKYLIILAFAAVYLIWGSTYLGIKYAIQSIPPFLMAGFRFLFAGTILYIIAKLRGEAPLRKENIVPVIISSFLLLVVGNGGVVLAEQRIPSGIAALLITMEPLLVVLLQWMKNAEHKPDKSVLMGIGLGLIGMFFLTGPSDVTGVQTIDFVGVLFIILSTVCWALGSIYSINANLPSSPVMNSGIQMLVAGVILSAFGSASGEWSMLIFENIHASSIYAFAYLVLFGSVIGLTSYSFLVKKVNLSSVSTYAYVNPIVAVLLGSWIGGETLSWNTCISGLFLISSVVLIWIRSR